ncbi:Homoserine dehydrogenase [Mariniblastus fucicola]|uniref:Homoserine dehydrogenase n=2 Tax=Mariniblastus fucicola TaxID=980251 RepID=A0A5B9PG60_9BACT|nr:Homoserine dehydrogenase [Mariniblastus fucicola]
MEKTGVAIVGMGTVGAGVARLLLDHGDRTARHAGRTLWLTHAVVRDLEKARDVELPEGVLTDDLQRVIDDPEVSVVVQLIGGIEPAKSIMLQLLESGKDVVTANKALLAQHGPELFDRARELGRSIAFEASVAGGIPIIANISQCLSANQIESLQGILNGTCNFIVSKMDAEGADYSVTVAEAQQLGYAEADPTMDVDGTDAAQKLAILAHLAFGARVDWSQIPRRGIDGLQAVDFKYAKHLGYRIKLIALARLTESGLALDVSPMLVKIGQPLAEVRANYNAVGVVGDAVGPVFFQGQGAGQMPTASAVVADLIDTAVGRTSITFETLELWAKGHERVGLADVGSLVSRYYLRFNVQDVPSVLSKISGALGRNGISIASVYQHDVDLSKEGIVPVVIVTKNTSQSAVDTALEELKSVDAIDAVAETFKILD